jgi:hypothetical protein
MDFKKFSDAMANETASLKSLPLNLKRFPPQ